MQFRDIKGLPAEELELLLSGMSDEEREEYAESERLHKEEMAARLDGLGQAIAERRAEAIKGRTMSGIEDEWLEDEEYYEGIDDANRNDMKAWTQKPPGRVAADGDDTSSNIFLNITRPYCDASGASLADMLLPTDDPGATFSIDPTPIPTLIPFKNGEIPQDIKDDILSQAGGDAALAAEAETKLLAKANDMMAQAQDKADKSYKRIIDWHVECQYHAAVRKVIEDAARIGTGVLKGPIPAKCKKVAYVNGELIIKEEIKPVSRHIDYRNLYPDPGCGQSIHNGGYIFERDDITAKQLRALIGVEGYNEEQILGVLEEGPTEAGREFKPASEMKQRDTKNLYEIWYFYGEVDREDMEAAGCECEDSSVPAQIVMVNNRVIKATMNPLDTGEFPYDVMVWQQRRGLWCGIGVARQIRTPQRMINGAGRNMMDNAGLAGGPMWAFNQGILSPVDGVASIGPRKGWVANEDADQIDISRAFTYFKMDMMVGELQAIIYLGLKMAEDVTGLPMIMQGQMGAQKLETLGQTQILNNNANIVRRRIARLFDDLITEPHVRRYYAYLLQYGNDDEKGDFVIDARGSSNLVERMGDKQKADEYLNLAANPVYGIDPKKAMKERLRADKLDPKNWEYDDDEWKEIVANLAQPQQDPRQAIAEMNAQIQKMKEDGLTARTQMEIESKERIAQMDAEIEQAVTVFEGDLKKQLAEMGYKGDKDLQFDKLKTALNTKVMELTTTKQLAGVRAPADQLPRPPVEPPQQARPGQSYQQ